jgi:hypothetical protein
MTEVALAPKYALDDTGKMIDAQTGLRVDTITVLSVPKPEEGIETSKSPSSESPLAMLARWRNFRQDSSDK